MQEPISKKFAEIAYEAASSKQAHHLVVLDVRKLTALTDFFVICHGHAHSQVRAIADEIQVQLKKAGSRLSHLERDKNENWVLLDFDDIVCHIFMEETRKFYSLEKLWDEAKKINFGKKLIDQKNVKIKKQAKKISVRSVRRGKK